MAWRSGTRTWLIPVDAELRMDVSAGQEALSLGKRHPHRVEGRRERKTRTHHPRCLPRQSFQQAEYKRASRGRALATRGFRSGGGRRNSVLVAFAAKHGHPPPTTAPGRNSPFTSALAAQSRNTGPRDQLPCFATFMTKSTPRPSSGKEPLCLRNAVEGAGLSEARGHSAAERGEEPGGLRRRRAGLVVCQGLARSDRPRNVSRPFRRRSHFMRRGQKESVEIKLKSRSAASPAAASTSVCNARATAAADHSSRANRKIGNTLGSGAERRSGLGQRRFSAIGPGGRSARSSEASTAT